MRSTPDISSATPPLTLGRLVVLVRDYDAALDFYSTAFGARVLFDAPSPTGDRYLHVGFGAEAGQPDARTGIWLLRATGSDLELVGRQAGGQPLAVFYTTDVRAAVERVAAAGGRVVRPVVTADGASFAHVTDLYGNEFVLVQLASGMP
ncbi:MAG TPA: VOC family protein [Noviherbaspirillum sp.]|nr:VOC family protein [Noviherbaspirillum sp.]